MREVNQLYKGIILAICAALICTGGVFAMTWTTANQISVAWNDVRIADNTFPDGSIVHYRLYTVPMGADKADAMVVGIAEEATYTITLTTQGRFYLGVQSLAVTPAGVYAAESSIAWSDDPAATAPGDTFGVQYFEIEAPGGIRIGI